MFAKTLAIFYCSSLRTTNPNENFVGFLDFASACLLNRVLLVQFVPRALHLSVLLVHVLSPDYKNQSMNCQQAALL